MFEVDVAMRSGVEPPSPGVPFPWYCGEAVQEPVYGGGYELDVAYLLGADAVDEVAVGFRLAAKVEALEEVLHHRAHLGELAAEPFLEGVGRRRVRLVVDDRVDQFLHVEEHCHSFRPACYQSAFTRGSPASKPAFPPKHVDEKGSQGRTHPPLIHPSA